MSGSNGSLPTSPASTPDATTPRATGECHACYRYGYASLARQTDGRWLCRECEDEAQHIAAGGTVVTVPCPECSDPTRPMRSRCPACGGTRTVRRLVPAPASPFANLRDDVADLLAASEAFTASLPPVTLAPDGPAVPVMTLAELTRMECGAYYTDAERATWQEVL